MPGLAKREDDIRRSNGSDVVCQVRPKQISDCSGMVTRMLQLHIRHVNLIVATSIHRAVLVVVWVPISVIRTMCAPTRIEINLAASAVVPLDARLPQCLKNIASVSQSTHDSASTEIDQHHNYPPPPSI